MTKNELRVMWFVPTAVAIAASWRPREGLSVQFSRTQSSDEQYDALTDGSVDAVVTSIDNVLHWNQRPGPQDFIVVAQIESTTPLSLTGSSAFKSPSDLKGADILVDAPENGFVIALRAILKKHGLTWGDYTLTPIGGVVERYSALIEGKGDATLLGPPFDSLAVEQGLNSIASVQDIYPEFPGQGLVVRKSGAKNHDALRDWLQDLEQAVGAIGGNTEILMESLQAKGIPKQAAAAIVECSPKTLVPDVEGIKLLINHRIDLGLVGANSTYAQIVDCSFLSGHLEDAHE